MSVPSECPKCGGSLVKIDGKYGVFYGCSNYRETNCDYKFSPKGGGGGGSSSGVSNNAIKAIGKGLKGIIDRLDSIEETIDEIAANQNSSK